MIKENLVQQIELVRQRLETNKNKLSGRANDPKRQILTEMYKVLAKYVRADKDELERLEQQLILVDEQKNKPTPSIDQPNPSNDIQTLEDIVWSIKDEFIKDKLAHLTKFVISLQNDQKWNVDRLKLCATLFEKQAKSTRQLLTSENKYLHAFAYQQINISQKSFLDWYTITKSELTKASPELIFQGKLSLQLKAIQNQLAILESCTSFSWLELGDERRKVQSAIDETKKWLETRLSLTNHRKFPKEKRQALHQEIQTLQIKLNRWSQLQEQRLSRPESGPLMSVKQQHIQTSAPIVTLISNSIPVPDYVAVRILWKDVLFRDGYVEIRSLINISQIHHHLNYSLHLSNARRSFQAFANILDAMGADPLEVWLSVRDKTIIKSVFWNL